MRASADIAGRTRGANIGIMVDRLNAHNFGGRLDPMRCSLRSSVAGLGLLGSVVELRAVEI
jgi:hypothetical protein